MERDKRKKILTQMVKVLKTKFHHNGTSNMYYGLVIQTIMDSTHLKSLTQAEVKSYLEKLLVICPRWIKKVKIAGSISIRMDKRIQSSSVLRRISKNE